MPKPHPHAVLGLQVMLQVPRLLKDVALARVAKFYPVHHPCGTQEKCEKDYVPS